MIENIGITPILKLTKDAMRALMAGAPMPLGTQETEPVLPSPEEEGDPRMKARILVDLYYTMQEMRKRLNNQADALDRGADAGDSHEAIDFVLAQAGQLESNAKLFLETLASAHPVWPWLSAVQGIGPVLAAGLLAHLKLTPTVGAWWRFAGLDPHQRWLSREELTALWAQRTGDVESRVRQICLEVGRDPESVLRDATHDFKTGKDRALTKTTALASLARIPFNRPLKTICWKIGDSFCKLGDRQDAFYAVTYRQRKALEVARNQRGDRAELARVTLEAKPKHAQAEVYAHGRLPDGRVDLMARRYTVKLFLSHLHEVWWRLEHGTMPPKPFAIAIQGHAHYIEPPYLQAVGLSPSAVGMQ